MSQSVPQPTDSSTKASTDPSKHFRKCSSCGEHGHFALDCEDIRYQNYGVSQNEGHKFLKESRYQCQFCHKTDHKSKDCPDEANKAAGALWDKQSQQKVIRSSADFTQFKAPKALNGMRRRSTGEKRPPDRVIPKFKKTEANFYKKCNKFPNN